MKTRHPLSKAALAIACIGAITLAACSVGSYHDGGNPNAVPKQANTNLEDVSKGREDNAGGQFDNGTSGIQPNQPSAGLYMDGPKGDPDNQPSEPLGPGATAEPYDMFFKQYGVNPFVDTEDDRFSTFAIDVDTGSYSICRDYLNRGHVPPTEAVRTEEFVNSFKYKYDAPKNGVFAIHMDTTPSRYGADLKHSHILRVGLQGKVVDAAERKPAVLTFVIDVSGSMNMENRLGYVKASLRMLVKQLRRDDYVGIAVYGSRGRKVLSHTNDPEAILEALDMLTSDGSTNAEEGIRIGYEMAAANFRKGSINRVILCSDGVANVGATGPEAILKTIEANRRKGITLSAVGFGMSNYNDTLMEQLGDKGDGHYAYVDTLDEAKKIFVDNLTGTLQVIARDVKMQVEFNPAVVKSYRLIGYENRDVADKDFRNNAVDGGEVGAGHSCTALFEIKLFENANGPIATSTVRWKHDEEDEYSEAAVEAHTKDIRTWEQSPVNLRLAANVAEFAELLRASYWAKNGSYDPLLEDVKKLIGETDDSAVLELANLVTKARDMKAGQPEGGAAGGK